MSKNPYITSQEFNQYADDLADEIRWAKEIPHVLVGLTTGGMAVADAIGERLNIAPEHRICLPVRRDNRGSYSLDGDFVQLSPTAEDVLQDKDVLVVDDSYDRGLLTRDVGSLFGRIARTARTGVLAGNKAGIKTNYAAEYTDGVPRSCFWEIGGERIISHDLVRAMGAVGVNAILATPGNLLVATALAKHLYIPSEHVGSIPAGHLELDERLVTLGNCTDRTVAAIGSDPHETALLAAAVRRELGTTIQIPGLLPIMHGLQHGDA